MLVIRRAAALPARMGRLGHMVFEHLHQARFANARLAAHQDDLPQALPGLGPALQEQVDFLLPSDQRGERTWRAVQATVRLHVPPGRGRPPGVWAPVVSACLPSGSQITIVRTRRAVVSLNTTVFGAASPCKRVARWGVSPRASSA